MHCHNKTIKWVPNKEYTPFEKGLNHALTTNFHLENIKDPGYPGRVLSLPALYFSMID
jgi:hypothetical protein